MKVLAASLMSGLPLAGAGVGIDSEMWELRATLGSGGRWDVCQSWERMKYCQSFPLSWIHHVAELQFILATALSIRNAHTKLHGVKVYFSGINQVVKLNTT